MSDNITEQIIQNNLNQSKNNYNDLIKYYNEQKIKFLKLYELASQKSEKSAIKSLNSTVFKELNNFNDNIAMNKARELYSKFQSILENNLDNNSAMISSLRNFAQEQNLDFNTKQKQGNEILNQLAESVFNQNEIENLIEDYLFSSFTSLNNYSIKQFLDYLISYRNNIVKDRITNLKYKSMYISNSYMQGMKGYMQEAAVANAFSKMAKKINDSGGFNIEVTGVGGANTEIDEIITFKIPNSFIVEGVSSINEYKFGIQSKSWVVPWDKKFEGGSSNMVLGNKADLLSNFLNQTGSSKLRHSWTYSVLWLSQLSNAIKATDNAVLWNTGTKLFWADTLIKQQVAHGRFIAFPWSKDKYEPSGALLRWNTIKAMNYKKEG